MDATARSQLTQSEFNETRKEKMEGGVYMEESGWSSEG